MPYLAVVDGNAGGWRVDQEALKEAIPDRRADVGIRSEHHSELRPLAWEFETTNGPGEAYLHVEGTCLYMDIWEAGAIRLAVLFRKLTPTRLDLAFCDEGYTFDVRLPFETTESELATW
ncbi:hypothetical protein GXW82_33760 [Streptacidiphilus sp. 4-A2]|nr:hypothetical protein [Streptacidiphilus sp. 4-A2]